MITTTRLSQITLICLLITTVVHAGPTPPTSSSESSTFAGPSGWRVAGAYALVIGLLFLLGWFLKRFPNFRRSGDACHGTIRIQTAISLGDKCRLISVDWEGRRLLVGVTPHHMTCLASNTSDDGMKPTETHTTVERVDTDDPPASFWKTLTQQIRTGGRLPSTTTGKSTTDTRDHHEKK